VVCSFGDASVNHATATAAFNTAGWCDHTGLRLPLLFVCEDNGLGISVRSPEGWVEAALRSRPGLTYFAADGTDLAAAYDAAVDAVTHVRRRRRPAVLHLRTVRLMGHAGADAETAYRSGAEIAADAARDPLLATARTLVEAGFADGTLGQLDLTVAVRMDWHEGFQLYGEHGSVVARTYNPWYYRSSDVEIFHERTASTVRPLGADGHFYRRQLEGLADAALNGRPVPGADVEDGLASVRAMAAIARSAESGSPVRVADVTGPV
jgi:hypothetical protein